MNEEDYRQLSELQHFSYCRRQWALIHIENQWNENILTTQGIIMHKHAHDESFEEVRGNKIITRGLRVKSDRLCITGICDIVEFIQDPDGISLPGKSGLWRVNPVEYKRGVSKTSDCDRMQLCGQVLCLEEMLCCKIDSADLFYGESHRREHVEMSDTLRRKTEDSINELTELFRRQHTPKVRKHKGCRMCSLKDICMPEAEYQSVRKYLIQHLGEL